MVTNYNWNGRTQYLVRRSGCEAVLQTVKGYEVQSPPVTISIVGDGGSINNKTEEQPDSTISLPWMKHFTTKTGVNPQAASTIISQLNNYHRPGSITGKDDPAGNNWWAKNKVTPPSGALKPPGEEQGHPPPLLLAGSNTTLTTTVGRASISTTTAPKQVISLPTKKGVPHVYHDYSDVPDVVGVVRKKTGGVTQPFPEKLHTMLDNDDNPSIVTWLPHGRGFLVRKPAEFTTQIMPKYFRQTKLTSFQRQLNLYGFRRLTQGADSGAYYHELFLKGRPQLCLRMQRQKIKGTGHKQPADVQTEPNFYTMVPSKNCSEMRRRDQMDLTIQVPTSVHPANIKPKETAYKSPLAELSPCSRGVANLLADMKSTHCSIKGRSLLDPNFSLGQSAMSSTVSLNGSHQSYRTLSPTSSLSTTQSSYQGNSPIASTSNELYVTKQRSMSLLGRVQNFPKPLKMRSSSSGIIDSSAFFWPPRKATIGLESRTTSIFETSITSSPLFLVKLS